MKLTTKLFLMATVAMTSLNATAAGYEIKANLKGAQYEGKMVKLGINKDLMQYEYLDSAIIKNGTVTFRGKLDAEKLLSLHIFPDDSRATMGEQGAIFRPELRVFMGNEKVEITAEVDSLQKDFMMYSAPLEYKNIQITGSKVANEYAAFQTELNEKFEAYEKASRPYYEFWGRREQSALKEGVETYKVSKAARNDYERCMYDFTKAHIKEPLGLYCLGRYADRFTLAEIQELEAAVPQKLKATVTGKAVMASLQNTKKSVPGAMFHDTELKTPDGKTFRISDYCGRGKYVLLEFWASWCGPCRADIPHIKEAYEHYHPQGFEIISISMDTNEKAWKAAVQRENMNWLQGSDLKAFDGSLSKVYNFDGIPFCILIGPDGKVVERNWRASAMDAGLIDIYGNHWGDRYTKGNTRFHIAGGVTDGNNHGHDSYTAADGKTIYLYYMQGDEQKIDSTVISDGSFVFTGDLGCPVQSISMTMKKPGDRIYASDMLSYYLEPGNSNVVVNVNDFSNPRTYGSKTQAEKDKFKADTKEYAEREEIVKKMEKASDAEREALREQISNINDTLRKKEVEYAKANPKSFLVPELVFMSTEYMPFDELEQIVNNMTDDAKASQYGQLVMRDYEGRCRTKVGVAAPLFASKDVQTGKMVDLKKFRGKYVLLDFWATWCVPCRKSNPHVLELYNKYHKKGLEVIFIADDDNNEAKLKEAIKKDGLQKMYHVVRGLKVLEGHQFDRTNDISEKYGVHAIPSKFLIDREGNIIGKMENDELDATLEKLLK